MKESETVKDFFSDEMLCHEADRDAHPELAGNIPDCYEPTNNATKILFVVAVALVVAALVVFL